MTHNSYSIRSSAFKSARSCSLPAASRLRLGFVGNVVNLNKFRKRKAKVERGKKAETNRRLHGRTKLERQRDALQKEQLARGLHGKKLQRDPADTEGDV